MAEKGMIVLNADEKEVTLKKINDMFFAIKQLYQWIDKDSLDEEMRDTIPQLIEYYMAEVSKIIGFESLSAKNVEKKHAEIREANQKIRELERKLGSGQSIEGLKEQLIILIDFFKKWWRVEGFGYVKKASFSEYGLFEAELGFSLSRSFSFTKKPVTLRQREKERLENLTRIARSPLPL